MRIAFRCGICGGRSVDITAPTRDGGRLPLCYACARALGDAWVRRRGSG